MRLLGGWLPSKLGAILCAAFGILLASVALLSQSASSSTLTVPSEGLPLVDTNYTYHNFELWDQSKWKVAKAAPIEAWIETHEKGGHDDYVVKSKYKDIKNFVGNPDYTWKSDDINDPDITDPLVKMGLNVDIREGGGYNITVAPERVLADKTHKVPTLVVPYAVDQWNVYWAMNTLVHFKKYNALCAQRGNFIIIYYVMPKSTAGNATQFSAPGADSKRVYLDVTGFAENGAKIADVPNLDWSDDNGTKSDPDAAIEHMDFIRTLNVAGRTSAKPHYGVSLMHPRADVRWDPQRVMHSMLGQHWMEGIGFLYNHGRDSDPAIKANFDEIGLAYSDNDFQGKRYLVFSPKLAIEQGRKLPLVIINSDASHANQYSTSQVYAEYLDYFKLAAQGEINILTLALGSVDDIVGLDYDLVKEAEKNAPIDPSRIYVTGHSHMGFESREFAFRHPDMIAAAATLGNASGFASPSYSHESIVADDERIEAWSKIDMPIIDLGAASEVTSPHTMPSSILNDYSLFIEAWQRRLKACRIPMQTREQIMGAEHSKDYVTRLYGLPNDGSSLHVIDGVEHYIIDVKNVDGKDHLRIVGIENMVHTTEPTMPMLAWTFMRRFARDQKTGQVIELY